MLWTRPSIRSLTDPLPRKIRNAGETNCGLTAPAGRICPLIGNCPRWFCRQIHTRASASTSRRTLAGRPAAGVRAGCRAAAPELADVRALCARSRIFGSPWMIVGEVTHSGWVAHHAGQVRKRGRGSTARPPATIATASARAACSSCRGTALAGDDLPGSCAVPRRQGRAAARLAALGPIGPFLDCAGQLRCLASNAAREGGVRLKTPT